MINKRTERDFYAEMAWVIKTLCPKLDFWHEIALRAAEKLAAGEAVSDTEKSILETWERSVAAAFEAVKSQ